VATPLSTLKSGQLSDKSLSVFQENLSANLLNRSIALLTIKLTSYRLEISHEETLSKILVKTWGDR
jgi:hypothetical protein